VELPDLVAVFDATRRRSVELDLRRREEEAPTGEVAQFFPRDKVGDAPPTPQLAVIGDMTRRESLRRSTTGARLRRPSNWSRVDNTFSTSIVEISLTTMP
jgi:hypothetical protein